MTTTPDTIERLIDASCALLDWAREHTGPHDPASPHALLVALQAALAAMGVTVQPDGRHAR
jgi:hypothetical protein